MREASELDTMTKSSPPSEFMMSIALYRVDTATLKVKLDYRCRLKDQCHEHAHEQHMLASDKHAGVVKGGTVTLHLNRLR